MQNKFAYVVSFIYLYIEPIKHIYHDNIKTIRNEVTSVYLDTRK
jgi:hypothetical protein